MVIRVDRRRTTSDQHNVQIVIPEDLRTTALSEPEPRQNISSIQLVILATPNEYAEWIEMDPNTIRLSQEELDSILERSKDFGAINAHLDSMSALLGKLERNLDASFDKLDSIKARSNPYDIHKGQ